MGPYEGFGLEVPPDQIPHCEVISTPFNVQCISNLEDDLLCDRHYMQGVTVAMAAKIPESNMVYCNNYVYNRTPKQGDQNLPLVFYFWGEGTVYCNW